MRYDPDGRSGGTASVGCEDKRRTDFRAQAKLMLRSALAHPISPNMAGYWQRKGKARQPLVQGYCI